LLTGIRDFEIITYVLSGLIEHKDSMGNVQTIPSGGVQYTCAGKVINILISSHFEKGISHSEYNRAEDTAHGIQIWITPEKNGLKPKYQSKSFPDELKIGSLCPIVGSKTSRGKIIQINQDITIFASILLKDQQVEHTLASSRKGYIHVCMTGGSVLVNDIVLGPGDGAMITEESKISIVGTSKAEKRAEFLLFDLP
jgi:redox-sensitive bicupin YhaK (pirin superfamily)